ncbi:MAG: Ig-like domain-containing protein [Bacteroidia bacterium]
MKLNLVNYFQFLALLCFWGCASRVAPDGGPRDEQAPEVITTMPAQKSLNIFPAKVEFEFNEFIQLKDGGSGILISPPMIKPPLSVLKGKNLILKFEEELEAQTTYTITLGASVADLTESNLLEPYSLVFSTGDILDSLSCSGIVKDAFTGKAMKDVMVLLYTSAEDSLPKTTLPRYFGKTNENGQYTINNIKEGEYSLFALKDVNNNYLYDQPGEKIGFISERIALDTQVVNIPLIYLSAEIPEKQRLIKSDFSLPFTLLLKYAKAPDSLLIQDFARNKVNFYKSDVSIPDSLILHLERTSGDSLKLFVKNFENGDFNEDTLELKLSISAAAGLKSKRKAAPDTSLKLSTNIEKGKLLPKAVFELYSSYPAVLNDTLKTYWRIENDTTEAILETGKTPYVFTAKTPLAPGRAVEFIAFPGAINDIYGRRSDTLRVDFRRMDEEEIGNIEILFEDLGKDTLNLIIEVLDAKSKVVFRQSIQKSDSLFITELNPGSYSMRLIDDKNLNTTWDPADFKNKLQAESTYYYSGDIAVRAGWDISVEWIIRENKKAKIEE